MLLSPACFALAIYTGGFAAIHDVSRVAETAATLRPLYRFDRGQALGRLLRRRPLAPRMHGPTSLATPIHNSLTTEGKGERPDPSAPLYLSPQPAAATAFRNQDLVPEPKPPTERCCVLLVAGG